MRPVRIANRCPSCGHQTLLIGHNGWLVCSLIGCKHPTLIGDVIAAAGAHHEDPIGRVTAAMSTRLGVDARLGATENDGHPEGYGHGV